MSKREWAWGRWNANDGFDTVYAGGKHGLSYVLIVKIIQKSQGMR